jgi:uncharacterized RDD family membrane protein YckC
MSEASNPFAPPTAEVADIAAAGTLALGGRGARLGATLIDLAIHLTLFFGVVWLLGWRLADDSVASAVRMTVLSLAIFFAVQGVPLAQRGQTLGKMVLGLRIVRPDGSRVSALRLFGLRYAIGTVVGAVPFVGWIYTLVDSLLIFRESHRCLHDQIADTVVIRT